MKKIILSCSVVAALAFLSSCKNNDEAVASVDISLNANVIKDFSTNVAAAEYTSLAAQTSLLSQQVNALDASRTDANLQAAQATWREARRIWEQSEAQLFGPVETSDVDPRIDSWPVDFNALQAQLDGNAEFTAEYINNLDEFLKGFHPIEFILWGKNGKKKASDLTDRELDYLIALAANVKELTAFLDTSYHPSSTTNFFYDFSNAGTNLSTYSQKEALEQLVTAMADICGEVAEGKIKEPFDAMDSTLEESPFAKSSMTDFTNNITGIQNVYTGKFTVDGKGIEDLVKKYNLNLDSEIKEKLATAIASMNAITTPFGKAIYTERGKVQTAMDAIGELKTALEEDLLPFVRLHAE